MTDQPSTLKHLALYHSKATANRLNNDSMIDNGIESAKTSAYNKSQHLILNCYNELLWQCIPQGETTMSEVLWEEHASEAIKEDYYSQDQSDFSNGPDINE